MLQPVHIPASHPNLCHFTKEGRTDIHIHVQTTSRIVKDKGNIMLILKYSHTPAACTHTCICTYNSILIRTCKEEPLYYRHDCTKCPD